MKIVITGTSSGIGKAIHHYFLRKGHSCICINRRKSKDPDPDSVYWTFDLTDKEQMQILLSKISSINIDVLINNAGGGMPVNLKDMNWDTFNLEMTSNLIAPAFLIQSCLERMKIRKFGRIINISSISSKRGTPYLFSYSAAKAGLNAITQSIAPLVSSDNITINSICPGGVKTDMSEKGRAEISKLRKMKPEDYQNDMLKIMGFSELIEPDEVAELVYYLCRPESRSITGQSFNICGNMEVI